MKTFQVTLSETLSVTRLVKAESAEEATKIVDSMIGLDLIYEEYSNYQKECVESDDKKSDTVPFVVKQDGKWVDTADYG